MNRDTELKKGLEIIQEKKLYLGDKVFHVFPTILITSFPRRQWYLYDTIICLANPFLIDG